MLLEWNETIKSGIFLLAFLMVMSSGFSQTYEAWLDSIDNPDYIANEYELEEVVFSDQQDIQAEKISFYRRNALTSTDDILENLEGVWMVKRGNYAAEPVLRGLSAGQINVTIDGMQMKGACTDKMDPVTSYIEPNNLDKIKVTHGAGGVNGGSTTGGSMDFSIRKPVFSRKIMGGMISSQYSSAARAFEQLASVNISHDNIAVNSGFTFRKGGNYRAGNGQIIPHSSYNKVNYNASLSWKLQQNQLLNVSFIGDDGWDIGYPALPMDVGYARMKILGLQYDIWQEKLAFDHIQAKVYFNTVDHAMDDSHRDVAMHMDMPGYTRTQGGYIMGELPYDQPITGKLKVEIYRSFAHAEMTMFYPDSPPMFMLTWPDIQRFVWATSGNVNVDLNDRTDLSVRMSLERNHAEMQNMLGDNQFAIFGYDSESKGKWLMNSGVMTMHKFDEKWNAFISLAYGERAPNESEQFGFYLFNSYDGYDYIGNPELEKERSVQAELGASFENDHLNWDFKLFGYRFFDYIYSREDPELSAMTMGANGVKTYENIGSAYLTGAENTLIYSDGRLSAVSVIKYVYGEGDQSQPLPLIPPLKSNFTLSYKLPFDLILIFAHETALRQGRINTDFNENPTGGFNKVDLGAKYSLTLGNVSKINCTISVDNVFDAEYYEHLDWGEIPHPGRNISIGVTYGF